MAKQKRLPGVKLAKGLEYKGKFPKGAKFVYGEPKKDGLRGCIINGKLYTYTGVRVVNGPLIEAAMKLIPKTCKANVFDGEFYYKDCRTTLGIVKTQKKHPLRKKLQFFAFDIISKKEFDAKKSVTPLKRRKTNLYLALYKMGIRFIKKHGDQKEKPVKMFKATVLKSEDKVVRKYHAGNCRRGHEGSMIKDPNSVYSFRKNRDWQKLKPYRESDMKVVGAYEEKDKHGKLKGTLGGFILKGIIDGRKVKTRCGGGFKAKERAKFWKLHKKGKMVGTIVEMKHEGLTINNAVRFPGFRRIHPEKNN